MAPFPHAGTDGTYGIINSRGLVSKRSVLPSKEQVEVQGSNLILNDRRSTNPLQEKFSPDKFFVFHGNRNITQQTSAKDSKEQNQKYLQYLIERITSQLHLSDDQIDINQLQAYIAMRLMQSKSSSSNPLGLDTLNLAQETKQAKSISGVVIDGRSLPTHNS